MSIERRSDATYQEFRAIVDREAIVAHGYGAVGNEAFQPRPIDDGRVRIAAVTPCDLRQVDAH
ncbi:MAG: hypothetical protein WA702_21925, partial [Bradyrhizobium sp.]|uniref:hypothetical protein n=1 Tax=Bradyrhizobium sp. TaxID=376 RepID=UPI003C7AB7D6